MQIYRARTYQKIKKIFGLIFFLQFIMCHKLPYICVHFWEKSDHFQLNPSNSILNCEKDVVGFETLFGLPERGPTSSPACKFTPMKIDNLFSVREQPRMSWKLRNVWRGSLFSLKWSLFKNHKFVSNKRNRPNSQFHFTYPLVLSHKV